jgi:hypothetical protein
VNAFEFAFVAGAPAQFKRLLADPLTPAELGQFRARLRAMKGITASCSRVYSFVTLDFPQRDAWLIYALAKPTEPGAVVVGGHYRFVLSRDGNQVFSTERLFRSCVTIPADPSGRSQGDGVLVTNLASLRPLETHVYLSLLNQMPLVINAPDGIVWKVDGLRIDAVGKR